jgi:phenylalanyl-tRNA synthetase beta chain
MTIRISLEWLREYVELPETAEAVAETLTMSGSKVDRVVALGRGWEGVVVARVEALAPVLGSDHLLLARVEHGGTRAQVVSGAPNLRVGDLVPLATVGTTLPNGLTIKARKMLGQASEGMLCSAAELGISADADGILILGSEGQTGMPLADLMPADHVLIVDVTPNRPDELCHLGIARELAAVLDRPLREPAAAPAEVGATAEAAGDAGLLGVKVEIDDPDLCARYVAREVAGITVGPSPAWMQRRLRAVGQRPISNVVDAANYAMLELGQPLHAFDRDRLAPWSGRPGSNPRPQPSQAGPASSNPTPAARGIVVRRAAAGESIACLDGRTRTVPEGALLIADAEQPQAIAGIIGGALSAVGPNTSAVVIESANFLGTSIRATSRRLGLRTDASSRFEKQLHPELAPLGAARLAALLQEVAGAGPSGVPVDLHPRPVESRPIELRADFVPAVLGAATDRGATEPAQAAAGVQAAGSPDTGSRATLGPAEVRARLARLGFAVEGEDGVLSVTPPPWRLDARAPEDLVEEVGRLDGYVGLPSTLPGRRLPVARILPPPDPEWEARDVALAAGFDEVIGLSFGNPADPAIGVFPAERRVLLLNPMASDQDRMRTGLLPGLVRIAERNNDAGNDALHLFELGRVFWPREKATAGAREGHGDHRDQDRELPEERRVLGLLRQAAAAGGRRADEEIRAGLLACRGLLEDLCGLSQWSLEVEQAAVPGLHPGRAARLWLTRGGERRAAGCLGQLHPDVARRFDLRGPLALAELDFEPLASSPRLPVARTLPRHPPVVRDLALSVPASTPAREVLAAIAEAGEAILRSVDLFDEYHGSQLPPERKGLALHLVYAAEDRTLTGEEAAAAEARIVSRLRAEVGAEVRD